jgi:F0F1-type ATP synthase membrane subunit c/vacuolar-type H+-ATPase subunit K
MKRVLRLTTLAIVATLAVAPAAFSQGCAQCYIEASASGSHAQKSLDIGILVLLLPSLLMFIGVIVLLIRRTRATIPLKQFPSTL